MCDDPFRRGCIGDVLNFFYNFCENVNFFFFFFYSFMRAFKFRARTASAVKKPVNKTTLPPPSHELLKVMMPIGNGQCLKVKKILCARKKNCRYINGRQRKKSIKETIPIGIHTVSYNKPRSRICVCVCVW